MNPRLTVLTLAVSDLEKAVDFYANGLGFKTDGIVGKEFEYGAVAFFDLENGIKLALWPRDSIAHDIGLQLSAANPTELTIGQNVDSKQEVDEAMTKALQAGAHILKPAADTFYGGYAGYFQDPDGHVWEIVYNPALKVD